MTSALAADTGQNFHHGSRHIAYGSGPWEPDGTRDTSDGGSREVALVWPSGLLELTSEGDRNLAALWGALTKRGPHVARGL